METVASMAGQRELVAREALMSLTNESSESRPSHLRVATGVCIKLQRPLGNCPPTPWMLGDPRLEVVVRDPPP